MIKEIISEEIENEDLQKWFLKSSNDTLIYLNPILDEDIIEVDFLDDDKKIVSVMYSNWDSMELIAIINSKGQVVCKGIGSIEMYISEYDLFIVEHNSDYIDVESISYFGLQSDTIYYAVINSDGKLLIDYNTNYISYEDELFYVNRNEYTLKEILENQ